MKYKQNVDTLLSQRDIEYIDIDLEFRSDGYQGLKAEEIAYLKYRRSRVRNNSRNVTLPPDLGDEFS